LKLRAQGLPVIFSYEEALGYCIGDIVVDKDGVSAAAVVMEMAVALQKEGKTFKASSYFLFVFFLCLFCNYYDRVSWIICMEDMDDLCLITRTSSVTILL
jgi:phosphomannomutase